MHAPLAKVAPHPYVAGAYTVNDPMAPGGQLLCLVNKQSAETIASKLNKQRKGDING